MTTYKERKFLKESIVNVKAYLGSGKVGDIIQFCRLVPIRNSWKKWTDEYGYVIELGNDRKARVKFRTNYKAPITNIYYKRDPIDYLNDSKYVLSTRCIQDDISYIWIIDKNNKMVMFSIDKSNKQNPIRYNSVLSKGINIVGLFLKYISENRPTGEVLIEDMRPSRLDESFDTVRFASETFCLPTSKRDTPFQLPQSAA